MPHQEEYSTTTTGNGISHAKEMENEAGTLFLIGV